MDSQRLRSILTSSTGRLAATYLVVIMCMSIGFSIVFYNTSTQQFNRPLAPANVAFGTITSGSNVRGDVRDFIVQRFEETSRALFIRLIWINLFALIAGGGLSYVLARWTLRPIEEGLEAQNQFVTDASHELRTPLTLLQTSNEVAKRKGRLSVSESNTLLDQNIEEVKKLKTLTDSLLDLLKNESDSIRTEDSNLQDIVSDSMSTVVALAQSKNIEIEDKTPPLNITTESALLSRVITILLENGLKYSDIGKKITISATHTEKQTAIEIADQGIGIKASDLPHIFNRFYRADKSRTSQDAAGYGLGLSIAEKIIRKLGGTITVQSTPGVGSVFTIRIRASRD